MPLHDFDALQIFNRYVIFLQCSDMVFYWESCIRTGSKRGVEAIPLKTNKRARKDM